MSVPVRRFLTQALALPFRAYLAVGDGSQRVVDELLQTSRRLVSRYLPINSESPTGAWGERCAWRFLRRRGVKLLDSNFRRRGGEIDLIGWHRYRLVFFEIKTYLAGSRSWGFERLDAGKRQRIESLAALYLPQFRAGGLGWRFDAVTVAYERGRFGQRVIRDIRWIEHAF